MRPYLSLRELETLRDSLAGFVIKRDGVSLSDKDTHTTMDVYQQWLALLIDLGYLTPDTLETTAKRLWTDLVQNDLLDVNNAMAECLHAIRVQSNHGFKANCKRISYHLYSLVKEDELLSRSGDVYAARRLCQVFAYTSRLSLVDLDLTSKMLSDYMEIEDNMVTELPDHLTAALNKIIRGWFKPYQPEVIRPQHGPGGVAGLGRASLETKYKDLCHDEKLDYLFRDTYWLPNGVRSSMDRISQTIFVPKSYKTFRTISMEPTTLQFYQQGVWKEIDRQVAANPRLRARIGFHEQERNQGLAQVGSVERSYATLDLSAASDSVSYELVKRLFRGTWILRYAVLLRSDRTLLPDGRLIQLKKFAPMGSSLCFPIETIIFAAICEYVTRGHRVSGDYSVFGDDIIVPTQCASQTMQLLTTLGFRVNREKSFYDAECWFRESCGAEFCDGYDVTPLRVSRQYASQERFVRLAKLIDLANGAYDRGYLTLRLFFLKKLREEDWTPLYSEAEVRAANYSNYHTLIRYNYHLHRIEAKVTALYAKCSKAVLNDQNEEIRYLHWFISTSGRYSLGDGFESMICKPTVKTKTTWRTKPFEVEDQDFWDEAVELQASKDLHGPKGTARNKDFVLERLVSLEEELSNL